MFKKSFGIDSRPDQPSGLKSSKNKFIQGKQHSIQVRKFHYNDRWIIDDKISLFSMVLGNFLGVTKRAF